MDVYTGCQIIQTSLEYKVLIYIMRVAKNLGLSDHINRGLIIYSCVVSQGSQVTHITSKMSHLAIIGKCANR